MVDTCVLKMGMKSSFESRSVDVFANDRTTTASTTRGREPGRAPRQPRPDRLCRTKLFENAVLATGPRAIRKLHSLNSARPQGTNSASACQKTSTARKHASNMPYSSVTVSGMHLNCVSSFDPVGRRPLCYCHSKSGKKSMP